MKYYGRPNKSLTPALHDSIEQFFQKKHGHYAGWAQGYLFYSNSKKDVPVKKSGPSKSKENKNVNQNKKKRDETKAVISNGAKYEVLNDADGKLIEVLPRTRSKRLKS